MEDAPGITDKLGAKPEDTAKNALDVVKRDAGVTGASITKAIETWSFSTYLICLKPEFQVVGHYEWGFTLTVDPRNAPYLSQSAAHDPSWTAGK